MASTSADPSYFGELLRICDALEWNAVNRAVGLGGRAHEEQAIVTPSADGTRCSIALPWSTMRNATQKAFAQMLQRHGIAADPAEKIEIGSHDGYTFFRFTPASAAVASEDIDGPLHQLGKNMRGLIQEARTHCRWASYTPPGPKQGECYTLRFGVIGTRQQQDLEALLKCWNDPEGRAERSADGEPLFRYAINHNTSHVFAENIRFPITAFGLHLSEIPRDHVATEALRRQRFGRAADIARSAGGALTAPAKALPHLPYLIGASLFGGLVKDKDGPPGMTLGAVPTASPFLAPGRRTPTDSGRGR